MNLDMNKALHGLEVNFELFKRLELGEEDRQLVKDLFVGGGMTLVDAEVDMVVCRSHFQVTENGRYVAVVDVKDNTPILPGQCVYWYFISSGKEAELYKLTLTEEPTSIVPEMRGLLGRRDGVFGGVLHWSLLENNPGFLARWGEELTEEAR